jgi:kumamolisin
MANTPSQGYEKLAGSERKPLTNLKPLGPVDPNESIEVSVYLRAVPSSNITTGLSEQQLDHPGRHLTREEYAARHSASPDDIAKVKEFAREHALTVVETDPVSRRVVLAGTAEALSGAFGTQLQRYEHEGRTFRGRAGPLHVPAELDQVVVGVFGLDDRPQAKPRLRYYDPQINTFRGPDILALPRETATTSCTPSQLAQLYDFPTAGNGSGQCIALIELGGGYKITDLKTYFQQLNLPLPQVSSVSVDRGHNKPVGDPNSADGEVDLDIEVAGAIAPEAHIAVYFAPNTDRGFLDAITQAIHDTGNKPSVISISWGAPEMDWTDQAMQAMNQAFQAAAALGITVCCAAGDNGSSDGVNDGQAHVDFPASSPYVLACGGTQLESANNQITSEVVWNNGPNSATGGGISDVFDLPTWQANAQVPPSINATHRVGRGVPDVAGNADPQTGYQVYVDGQSAVFGGTSAVAPLWAALIALMNQQRGEPLGYLNPILYQHQAQLFQNNAMHNVTSGNNGGYTARQGWNACTGWGTPDGAKLLQLLTGTQLPDTLTTR